MEPNSAVFVDLVDLVDLVIQCEEGFLFSLKRWGGRKKYIWIGRYKVYRVYRVYKSR